LHRYFYGYANPLRYTDPTGNYSWEQFKGDVQWGVNFGVEYHKEFGKGLAETGANIVTLGGYGGAVAEHQAGGVAVEGYAKGVLNTLTLGMAEGAVGAYAEGEGAGGMALGAGAGLGKTVLPIDEVQTIADPTKSGWEKAQAAAVATTKVAGLAAGGVAAKGALTRRAASRTTLTTEIVEEGGLAQVTGKAPSSPSPTSGFRPELRQSMRQQQAQGVPRGEAAARIRRGEVCFPAGTLVHTKTGLKPIETIAAGDTVLSADVEGGGLPEFRKVVRTFERATDELVRVTLAGARAEGIVATPEHPFFTHRARDGLDSDDEVDGDWVGVGRLEPGDLVRLASGEWIAIAAVVGEQRHTKVYNFEVEEYHTYHVGQAGVLVHNACKPGQNTKNVAATADDVAVGSTRHVELTKASKGGYKITFKSKKGYAGKGGTTRARRSGRQRSRKHDDPVESIEHRPASTDKEAFAIEAEFLEELGGPSSPSNYNIINSPGKKR
jgi:hypothetical protein